MNNIKTFFLLPILTLLLSASLFSQDSSVNNITIKFNLEPTEELTFGAESESQIQDPIKWNYSVNKLSEGEYELIAEATIEDTWHLYSRDIPVDAGPVPTAFVFKDGAYTLNGALTATGNIHTDYDPNFDAELSYYTEQVIFKQKVKTTTPTKIEASLEFMVCNNEMCLPPEFIELEFDLASKIGRNKLDNVNESTNAINENVITSLPNVDLENPLGNCGEKKKDISNIWLVFLFGFIGGLIALLTPCVFPMIPLTVSFFTKGNEGSKGLGKALLYGFFIFFIYAILSVPFHFNADPAVLSEVATSVWLNILFFVVFVVFAVSFFGYFEITLPSSFTNKADSASEVGGIIGIFFMALTLALVSFSCTGPILGTVLGSALKNGPWPISAAMSGFGIALGLPFAFFAAFPSILNKLPKSGGWLNSIKVVLGFIELALALKFLSNADLVEQWGLIKRETFFLIWTLLSIGLVLYLLGVIKFPHDSSVKNRSTFRIIFTSIIIAFTIYIAPGVMKNPPWSHSLLSGFPPPGFYGWYENDSFHSEFTDFDEALLAAQEQNKPLLIDFTGWACVNCRKMEETVWTVESIKKRLKEDFILVSLYVDDKVELPKEQQGVFEYEINGEIVKKNIRTIGNKWATFQTQVFNNNSQPYYVMLSPDGYLLGNPIGYTSDANEFAKYLDCGLEAYKNKLSTTPPSFKIAD